jgi:hypothetical protein
MRPFPQRVFAILIDIVVLSGFVLIGMEVFGLRRAPLTPVFLAVIIVVSLFAKVVFKLRDGFFRSLGVTARGSAAQWDEAIFGRLYRRRAEVALLGISTLLALALLEVTLRLSLHRLPVALANKLAGSYSANGDGIYRPDLDLRLVRMRPHYRRTMFFNGFTWTHQTDALGFRNSMELMQADIVLLGDSMIYGHGVEETQTVASHLRTLTKRSVANLGQQANGMHEEYQFLLHPGRSLKPKWVFLFLLNNDITDTVQALSTLEQERFLEIPDGRFEDPYAESKATSKRALSLRRRAWNSLQDPTNSLYVVRAVEFAYKALTKPRITSLHRSAPPLPSGSPGKTTESDSAIDEDAALRSEPFVSEPELVLAYRFQVKGFRQMQRVAQQDGFKLAVIYFATIQEFDEVFDGLFQKACRAEGITYVSLRDYYRQREAEGVTLFLKNDGHLNDTGARATAEELLRLFPELKSQLSNDP